jgi:phosphomannomutase
MKIVFCTLHVRRSNTEPVVRYLVETSDPAAATALADEIRTLIESCL